MHTKIVYGKHGFFIPPDITHVQALPDRHLILTYANGEIRRYDASGLSGKVFEPLKEDKVFLSPEIQSGTITWANGSIDIDPECLYAHSIPVTQ